MAINKVSAPKTQSILNSVSSNRDVRAIMARESRNLLNSSYNYKPANQGIANSLRGQVARNYGKIK